MKMSAVHIAVVLLLIVLTHDAFGAPTLQWTTNLGIVHVVQLVSDGRGGCAVTYSRVGGGIFELAWFDAKGNQLYSNRFTSQPAVIACEKNALVFCFEDWPRYAVVVVDRKGTEWPLQATHEYYVDQPSIRFGRLLSRPSDKYGFFVQRVTQGGEVILVRFAY